MDAGVVHRAVCLSCCLLENKSPTWPHVVSTQDTVAWDMDGVTGSGLYAWVCGHCQAERHADNVARSPQLRR